MGRRRIMMGYEIDPPCCLFQRGPVRGRLGKRGPQVASGRHEGTGNRRARRFAAEGAQRVNGNPTRAHALAGSRVSARAPAETDEVAWIRIAAVAARPACADGWYTRPFRV